MEKEKIKETKQAKTSEKISTEKIMSDKVKSAVLSGIMKLPTGNRLKCNIAIREMGFKSCKYDVIGYNKQENTVYIFECKLGTNITSIGQAFGQILGYKAVLKESGYEFLLRFYEKYHEEVVRNRSGLKIKLEDWIEIVNTKKMNFKFFTVFREQAKELANEILEIKGDQKFRIGVLTITKGGMCTPHLTWKKEIDNKLIRSDRIEINLIKKFTARSFLEELQRKMKKDIHKKYPKFRSYIWGNVFQIKLFPHTHYEVWLTRGNRIAVGLHIETDKKNTERIYKILDSRRKDIKRKLGKDVIFNEKWGRGWATGKGSYWSRIYEESERKKFDENFLKEISERLKGYIEIIQPVLETSKKRIQI